MIKRLLSGMLGCMVLLSGCFIFYETVSSLVENSAWWLDFALDFAGLAVASALFILGFRYVRFAYSGKLGLSMAAKSFVIGVGCFFPGALFSMPFTIYWASHKWPSDGQSGLAAMAASVCIGVFAVAGYWFVAFLQVIHTRSPR